MLQQCSDSGKQGRRDPSKRSQRRFIEREPIQRQFARGNQPSKTTRFWKECEIYCMRMGIRALRTDLGLDEAGGGGGTKWVNPLFPDYLIST